MRVPVLEISNGLPPPEPDPCVSESWPAFCVEAAAAAVVVLLVAAFFFVLELVFGPVLSLASVACAVVVEAAAVALSVLSVVSVVLALVVFSVVECNDVLLDALDVVVAVVLTWTPGLVVGIVTESAADDALSAIAEDDFATVVVVFAAAVGHNACIMPPFITIPSNVFELTETSEHESLTSLATEVNAD
jgi:hypothetical protein